MSTSVYDRPISGGWSPTNLKPSPPPPRASPLSQAPGVGAVREVPRFATHWFLKAWLWRQGDESSLSQSKRSNRLETPGGRGNGRRKQDPYLDRGSGTKPTFPILRALKSSRSVEMGCPCTLSALRGSSLPSLGPQAHTSGD